MKPEQRLNHTELASLCALAIILIVGLMAKELPLLIPGDTSRDFAMLYVTAERARARQPLYTETDPALAGPLLNFNPPHLHLLLLPLTSLPLRTAYVIWNGISLLLLGAVLRISVGETGRRLTRSEWCLVAACVLASAGVAATLRMGQVSMWLALLLTLAWRAARRGNWTPAGVWLGLAMSVKPFLLLGLPVLLIRGRMRAALIAAVVAMAAIAAGGAWLGWSAVTDWLEVFTSSRRGTTFAFNAALAGVVARAGAPAIFGLLASGVLGVLTLWRTRGSDEDTAWALWVAAALLCSPLGWIYYLPMLIGPLFALAAAGRLPGWTWWVLPAFLPPPVSTTVFQHPAILAVTLGSIFCWGLLGLWLAVFLDRRTASTTERQCSSFGRIECVQ